MEVIFVHLSHSQAFVLENKTFHHKVLSKLYLNTIWKSNVKLRLWSRNCTLKKEIKIMENTYTDFLRYKILKVHYQVWDKFLANESTLKMMKNAFYFTLKALFVFEIF